MENSVILKLPWCVVCPAEPVGALGYGLDLSAGLPSRLAHILSGGIAMDTSPGSSSVDFPSHLKLVGPLSKHPCGKDCKERDLFALAKAPWRSFLSLCLSQKFVQP